MLPFSQKPALPDSGLHHAVFNHDLAGPLLDCGRRQRSTG